MVVSRSKLNSAPFFVMTWTVSLRAASRSGAWALAPHPANAMKPPSTAVQDRFLCMSVPLRHFFQHHLGRAPADRQHACIAPQPFDCRLADVAHAAMELLA